MKNAKNAETLGDLRGAIAELQALMPVGSCSNQIVDYDTEEVRAPLFRFLYLSTYGLPEDQRPGARAALAYNTQLDMGAYYLAVAAAYRRLEEYGISPALRGFHRDDEEILGNIGLTVYDVLGVLCDADLHTSQVIVHSPFETADESYELRVPPSPSRFLNQLNRGEAPTLAVDVLCQMCGLSSAELLDLARANSEGVGLAHARWSGTYGVWEEPATESNAETQEAMYLLLQLFHAATAGEGSTVRAQLLLSRLVGRYNTGSLRQQGRTPYLRWRAQPRFTSEYVHMFHKWARTVCAHGFPARSNYDSTDPLSVILEETRLPDDRNNMTANTSIGDIIP